MFKTPELKKRIFKVKWQKYTKGFKDKEKIPLTNEQVKILIKGSLIPTGRQKVRPRKNK